MEQTGTMSGLVDRAKKAATKTFRLKPGKKKNGYENTFKIGKVFESGKAKFHRFIVRLRSILSLTVYATIVANLTTVKYYAFQKRNVERLQNTWPTKCLNRKTALAVPQSLACENIRFSSLFAARGRFAWRNVCDSAAEIPY